MIKRNNYSAKTRHHLELYDEILNVYHEPTKVDQALYIVHNPFTNLFKIGYATDVFTRINCIETSCGSQVNILLITIHRAFNDTPPIYYEKCLHDFFKSKRILGEWFKLSIKDLLAIDISVNNIYCDINTWEIRSFIKSNRDILTI